MENNIIDAIDRIEKSLVSFYRDCLNKDSKAVIQFLKEFRNEVGFLINTLNDFPELKKKYRLYMNSLYKICQSLFVNGWDKNPPCEPVPYLNFLIQDIDLPKDLDVEIYIHHYKFDPLKEYEAVDSAIPCKNYFFEFVEQRKYLQAPVTPMKKSNPTTFHCVLTKKQLKILYDNLIRYEFIDPGTDQSLFIKVFSGVPVGELTGKIKWIDLHISKSTNKQTLLELIHGLYADLDISILYDTIIYCFIDINGKEIDRDSLKSSFSHWKKKGMPGKSDREIIIQTILKNLPEV